MKKSLFKYLFYGLLLLFLFHFETLYIGPIKISHLWKGLVLVYLLFSIIKNKQKALIYKPFIWIAILQLVNIELINNPVNAVVSFSTTILLPVMGIFMLKYPFEKLKKGIMFFSVFIILSFLPYKFGLIESIGEGYDLEDYGGSSGIVGCFQNVHGASISLAGALLTILFFWFEGSYKKSFLTILFILGFYFLLNTYVRTGLAMFIIGALPILFHFGKKKVSTFIQLGVLIIILGFLVSNLVLSNEVLLNRILGKHQYRIEDSFEKIGSGRGLIYLASVQIFWEANIVEKNFGIGRTEQINRIYNKTRLPVVSHNGFLNLLLANGIISLFVFLLYLFKIHKFIKQTSGDYKHLVQSLFFAFLVMTFVQDYNRILSNLFLMLAIGIVYNQNSIPNTQLKKKLKLIKTKHQS